MQENTSVIKDDNEINPGDQKELINSQQVKLEQQQNANKSIQQTQQNQENIIKSGQNLIKKSFKPNNEKILQEQLNVSQVIKKYIDLKLEQLTQKERKDYSYREVYKIILNDMLDKKTQLNQQLFKNSISQNNDEEDQEENLIKQKIKQILFTQQKNQQQNQQQEKIVSNFDYFKYFINIPKNNSIQYTFSTLIIELLQKKLTDKVYVQESTINKDQNVESQQQNEKEQIQGNLNSNLQEISLEQSKLVDNQVPLNIARALINIFNVKIQDIDVEQFKMQIQDVQNNNQQNQDNNLQQESQQQQNVHSNPFPIISDQLYDIQNTQQCQNFILAKLYIIDLILKNTEEEKIQNKDKQNNKKNNKNNLLANLYDWFQIEQKKSQFQIIHITLLQYRLIYITCNIYSYMQKIKNIDPHYLFISEFLNYMTRDQLYIDQYCIFISYLLKKQRNYYIKDQLTIKETNINILKILNQDYHGVQFICGVFLAKIMRKSQLKGHQMQQFIDVFDSYLNNLNKLQTLQNHLKNSINSVIVLLTISYILLQYSCKPQCENKLKTKNIAQKYLDIAINITQSIDNPQIIKSIIFNRLIPTNQPIMDMLQKKKYFFQSFFVLPIISQSINDKWHGNYRYDYNFLAASTNLSLIIDSKHHFTVFDQTLKMQQQYQNTLFVQRQNNSINNFNQSVKDTNKFNKFNPLLLSFCNYNYQKIKSTSKRYIFKSGQNHIYQEFIYQKSIAVRERVAFLYSIIVLLLFTWFLTFEYLLPIQQLNSIPPQSLDFLIYEFVDPKFTNNWYCDDFQTRSQVDLDNFDPQQKKARSFLESTAFLTSLLSPQYFCETYLSIISCDNTDIVDYYMDDCTNFCEGSLELHGQVSFDPKQNFSDSQNISKNYLLFIIPMLYIIPTIIGKYQVYKFNQPFKLNKYFFSFYDIINLGLCVTVIVLFYYQSVKDQARDMIQNQGFDEYQNNLRGILQCGVVIIVLLWIKLFEYLEKSRVTGILIRSLFIMIFDLFGFLIVLVILLIMFTSIFYLLYKYKIDSYKDLDWTIINLFQGILGEINYEDHNLYAVIAMTIFLFFGLIMLFNMLIAILTKTYEKTDEISNMEYGFLLYKDYKNKQLKGFWSSFISFPVPFNIVSGIISIIIYPFCSNEQRKNIIIKIMFFPVIFLPMFLIFLALNIVFLPFAYLKTFYSIFIYHYQVQKSKVETNNASKLSNTAFVIYLCTDEFLWLILGIFQLLYYTILKDSFYFFTSTYYSVDSKKTFQTSWVYNFKGLEQYFDQYNDQDLHEIQNNEKNKIFDLDYYLLLVEAQQMSNKNRYKSIKGLKQQYNSFFIDIDLVLKTSQEESNNLFNKLKIINKSKNQKNIDYLDSFKQIWQHFKRKNKHFSEKEYHKILKRALLSVQVENVFNIVEENKQMMKSKLNLSKVQDQEKEIDINTNQIDFYKMLQKQFEQKKVSVEKKFNVLSYQLLGQNIIQNTKKQNKLNKHNQFGESSDFIDNMLQDILSSYIKNIYISVQNMRKRKKQNQRNTSVLHILNNISTLDDVFIEEKLKLIEIDEKKEKIQEKEKQHQENIQQQKKSLFVSILKQKIE